MWTIFRSILYDPLRARIAYDGLAAGSAFVSVWIILFLFDAPLPDPWIICIFVPLFLFACGAFGLYGVFRLASVGVKITSLTSAALVTGLFFYVFQIPLFFIVLTLFVVLIVTVLPRIAFAFSLEGKGRFYSQALNQAHLPVLVVGGGGYIGSHVVAQLLAQGFGVRVFDTFHYGKEVLKAMSRNRKLELIEGDVSDMYKLTLAMQGVGAVIHLAGIVGDPACAVDPVLTRHVNIVSTRLLKESAKAFGVRRFIFASSCSVYGATTKKVDERSALHPVSLYAQTKIDSEKELLSDMHDSFHPTILRFATVFGHSYKPRFDLVANLFVAQAFHNGKITLTGKDQWRPFIHVSDVARAIVLTLQAPESKVSRQIFNVGDDDLNMQIGVVAQTARDVVGTSKKGKKVQISERTVVGDRRNYFVSFRKIRQTLGFQASVDMKEGMREMCEFWKKGAYQRVYTDPYYSNLESAKELTQTFHTKGYQSSHISVLSEIERMEDARKTTRK